MLVNVLSDNSQTTHTTSGKSIHEDRQIRYRQWLWFWPVIYIHVWRSNVQKENVKQVLKSVSIYGIVCCVKLF